MRSSVGGFFGGDKNSTVRENIGRSIVAALLRWFDVGDVIEPVDGENVRSRAKRLVPYIAASTEQSAIEIFDTAVGAPTISRGVSRAAALANARYLGARYAET